MQLPYFFKENIIANKNIFTLSEETSKHCVQVLRMKEKELLQLTDGKGNLLTASIIKADKKNCEAKAEETKYKEQGSRKISIAISLLKNANRFEWFLEKATELGIAEIIPLLCARTERQHFRFERLNSILISAMLQSRQVWLPVLHQPSSFSSIITSSPYKKNFIAHCLYTDKKELTGLRNFDHAQILIGPEGDFTQEEISLALNNNFQPVSLGATRLRTETAGITAAALLMNL